MGIFSKKEEFKYLTKNDLIKMRIRKPKIQREINKIHLKELIQKIKHEPQFLVPLYIGKINKIYYIIDGQHRLEAIRKINIDPELKIPVIITKFKTTQEFNIKFSLINDTLPLSETCVYKQNNFESKEEFERKRKIIEETFTYFCEKYEFYFKIRNKRLSRPFIDCNDFQDDLKMCGVIKKYNIQTSNELIDKINTLNKNYEDVYCGFLKTPERITGLKKIIEQGEDKFLFLGLEKNWAQELAGNNIKDTLKKDAIKKYIRDKVWELYIGKEKESICICCNEKITKRNYHCGHIISDKNGGYINVYNLRPICMGCNTSMGEQNMFDYMKINKELSNNMKLLYENNKQLFQKI
jgi:hypothetical protein